LVLPGDVSEAKFSSIN